MFVVRYKTGENLRCLNIRFDSGGVTVNIENDQTNDRFIPYEAINDILLHE